MSNVSADGNPYYLFPESSYVLGLIATARAGDGGDGDDGGGDGGGSFSTDISRQVSIPSYGSTEESSGNASVLGANLEISQEITTGERGQLMPSLGISWLQVQQDAYSESTTSKSTTFQEPHHRLETPPAAETASYSLRSDALTYSSVPLELGLRLQQPCTSGGMTVPPKLSVAYSWDLANTSRPLTVYLQGLGQLTSGSTESLSYGSGSAGGSKAKGMEL